MRGGGEEGRAGGGGGGRGEEGRGFILNLDEMVEESTVQEKVSYLLVGFRAITIQFLSHPCGIRTALPSSPSHTLQLFDCSNHPT